MIIKQLQICFMCISFCVDPWSSTLYIQIYVLETFLFCSLCMLALAIPDINYISPTVHGFCSEPHECIISRSLADGLVVCKAWR